MRLLFKFLGTRAIDGFHQNHRRQFLPNPAISIPIPPGDNLIQQHTGSNGGSAAHTLSSHPPVTPLVNGGSTARATTPAIRPSPRSSTAGAPHTPQSHNTAAGSNLAGSRRDQVEVGGNLAGSRRDQVEVGGNLAGSRRELKLSKCAVQVLGFLFISLLLRDQAVKGPSAAAYRLIMMTATNHGHQEQNMSSRVDRPTDLSADAAAPAHVFAQKNKAQLAPTANIPSSNASVHSPLRRSPRGVSIQDNDDDDFVKPRAVQPRVKLAGRKRLNDAPTSRQNTPRRKLVETIPEVQEEGDGKKAGKTCCRCNPQDVLDAINIMSDIQKGKIAELGWGKISRYHHRCCCKQGSVHVAVT